MDVGNNDAIAIPAAEQAITVSNRNAKQSAIEIKAFAL
jgi:hypothetical protein